MSANDRRLTVDVSDGELRILVGINTLAFSARHSPDDRLCWLDEEIGDFVAFDILDPRAFACDVVRAIDSEVCNGGDGTTYLHRFLDDAMVRAMEDGSIAVSDKPSVVKW